MNVKFDNYLLKLDDLSFIRKGSDSIRIYYIGKIIEKIYSGLKYYKSIEDIEKDTRCQDTYFNWINHKTGISIHELYKLCLYWKKVCEKTQEEFLYLWEEIYNHSNFFGCTNGKPIRLPKYIDCDLAYLMGYIMGDGHLADPNKSYDKKTSYNSEVRITDGHKETFIFLKIIFKCLFNYEPKIYSELSKINKSFYRFVIRVKPIHRFLMTICEIPTGNKSHKTNIPELIQKMPEEIQKAFITGFFDADGCLRLAQGKYPEVSISQLDPKILISIIEFCKKLNIRWNGPYKADCQRNHGNSIKISNDLNIERFLNNFKSRNPIKLAKRDILWKKIRKSNI